MSQAVAAEYTASRPHIGVSPMLGARPWGSRLLPPAALRTEVHRAEQRYHHMPLGQVAAGRPRKTCGWCTTERLHVQEG